MNYIGIDLGTSAVKLLLMEGSGKILKIVSREYPICFPKPGWSEQNPYDWFQQSMDGLKELLEGTDKKQVAGISFGGQMHGLVVLDETNEVIRPAILWNDGRTAKECDYLNQVIGKERLSEYTANISFTGFTAPKVLWMKENEPENFAKIQKLLLPKDYLAFRLSGNYSTDVSDASGTLFFDVKNRCWSKEMCDICGIKEEWLPEVYESYEVVGTLLPELAKQLGLPENVKIVAGAGDNAAAAVGTGTVGDGACNQWWMDRIIGTQDYANEQEKIKALGENHVCFLPYLMGERSPHNDPKARGTFIGLTMDTTREDMTLAVLEGVAFALRDSFEVARSLGIPIARTRICGGGAKSPLLKKIVANVLNIPVEVPENEQGPSMGAAMLAAVACGEYPTVKEAASAIVKIADTIEPEAALAAKYEKQYQKFRQIYPACRELFQTLA